MARLALDSVTDSVLQVVQPELCAQLSDSYFAEGKPVQLLSVGVPLLALIMAGPGHWGPGPGPACVGETKKFL